MLRCVRHVPEGPCLVPRRAIPLPARLLVDAIELAAGGRLVLRDGWNTVLLDERGGLVASFPDRGPASALPGTTHVLLASGLELDELDVTRGVLVRRVLELSEDDSDELLAVRALSAREAVVWTRERGLVLLDLTSAAAVRAHPLPCPGYASATLLAHPDGRRVLAFSADTTHDIVVWDAHTGLAARIDGSDRIRDAALAPDGLRVAVATEHAVLVIDLATGAVLFERPAESHTTRITWLSGHVHDDRTALLVVASANRLELLAGDEVVHSAPLAEVPLAVAAPSNDLLLLADRTHLSTWQLTRGPRCFEPDGRPYTSVLPDPARGEAIVSGWGLPPQRWDLTTGRFLGPLAGDRLLHGEFVALAPPLAHVYSHESVQVINLDTESVVGGVHDHGLDGGSASVRHVSATRTRILYAFPPHSALRVAELHHRGRFVLREQFDLQLADATFLDPAGTVVVSGQLDGLVRVLDVATGTELRTIVTPTPVTRVAITRGAVVAGHADGTVSVWDATTGAALHTWAAHPTAITALAADDEYLATASADAVRAWSIRAPHGPPTLLHTEPTATPSRGLAIAHGRVHFLEAGRLVLLELPPPTN